MPKMFSNIARRTKLNRQWETAHKKEDQHYNFKPHTGSSWYVFAYFKAYIDLHRDFRETRCPSVRNWIFLAILLYQYSHHQFSLIRSLLRRIYSTSRVIFNAQPFSFIPLRFSDLNRAKNIQHACNIYRFLQVHLAPFSAWNGFGVEEFLGGGGVFGRWKTREERLWDGGGIWPDRAVIEWKNGLENWNILMWKAVACVCFCYCGRPCDKICGCKYFIMICIHKVSAFTLATDKSANKYVCAFRELKS